jgi:hypothetical protein
VEYVTGNSKKVSLTENGLENGLESWKWKIA